MVHFVALNGVSTDVPPNEKSASQYVFFILIDVRDHEVSCRDRAAYSPFYDDVESGTLLSLESFVLNLLFY